MTKRNPFGEEAQAKDRVAILDAMDARIPYEDYEDDLYAALCSICDGLHGGLCPLESPDPGYYADELAAGR